MATEEIRKISGSISVANGYDSSGNTRTASISLPALSTENFDAAKLAAYTNAVRPVIANDILGVFVTRKSQLFNE